MQKNTVDTKAARELLSRHHILKHLFPSLIERLLEECEICSFEENQSIFIKGDEGDALYGILSGKVRISVISLEGKEIILNIMGQGELFGEIALLDEGPRTADATAQTDCQLIRLRRTCFVDEMRVNSDLAIGVIQLLCERLRWISDGAESMALLNAPARLAKCLLNLAATYGVEEESGTRIAMKINQEELGRMIGARRESVSTQMSKWRTENLLSLEKGTIILRDLNVFRAISGM